MVEQLFIEFKNPGHVAVDKLKKLVDTYVVEVDNLLSYIHTELDNVQPSEQVASKLAEHMFKIKELGHKIEWLAGKISTTNTSSTSSH